MSNSQTRVRVRSTVFPDKAMSLDQIRHHHFTKNRFAVRTPEQQKEFERNCRRYEMIEVPIK